MLQKEFLPFEALSLTVYSFEFLMMCLVLNSKMGQFQHPPTHLPTHPPTHTHSIATVFNNANQQINVYGDEVEVDYRGYEVGVEVGVANITRILSGMMAD